MNHLFKSHRLQELFEGNCVAKAEIFQKYFKKIGKQCFSNLNTEKHEIHLTHSEYSTIGIYKFAVKEFYCPTYFDYTNFYTLDHESDDISSIYTHNMGDIEKEIKKTIRDQLKAIESEISAKKAEKLEVTMQYNAQTYMFNLLNLLKTC